MRRTILPLLTLLLAASTADAHFLWLVRSGDDGGRVEVHFNELAEPGEPESPGRIKGMRIRRHATLSLHVAKKTEVAADGYAELPQLVTSFGAAVLDGGLYVYGGHTGRAHSYYREAQAETLWRLDLRGDRGWQPLAKGPPLQGLAMVAHGGKLFRIGGFTAKNRDGQEQDLWSQADVAAFDTQRKEKSWRSMPPLPEPRSSFDAAVLDDKIYVVGGWQMAGDQDTVWHKTAHVLNLAVKDPQWRPLPEPPFQRRALSVAAHDGKLYVIGGMRPKDGPTRRVDVFDPKSGKWTQGPQLQGEKMDGFGSSAFAAGGRLYVSTYSGALQRLSEDGKSWKVVRTLERARFFHRMLPLSDRRLIIVGGASMTAGKFGEVDVIDVGLE